MAPILSDRPQVRSFHRNRCYSSQYCHRSVLQLQFILFYSSSLS